LEARLQQLLPEATKKQFSEADSLKIGKAMRKARKKLKKKGLLETAQAEGLIK